MKLFQPSEFTGNGYGKTDKGKVRDHNEDSFLCDNTTGVYLVADGMGGHMAGETASGLCVDNVSSFFKDNTISDIEKSAAASLELANKAIYEAAALDTSKKGMGCTAALLVIKGNLYCGTWAGDSRIYLLRKGKLTQVTRDHSKVQMLVDAKIITAEQALTHPERNIITRSIGTKEAVEIDAVSGRLKENDIFLLCSDGVCGMMPEKEILGLLASENNPQSAAEKLVAAADEMDGSDNETAVVVRIMEK